MPSPVEAVRRWWLRVGGRHVDSLDISPETAVQILAAVARECRSYTDPRADYPLASTARAAQLFGAAQRKAPTLSPPPAV